MGLSPDRKIFEVDYLTPKKVSTSKNGNNLYGVNLAFAGKETQHSTHALHPYVAAINPPLVEALIGAYFPEGENILDPYCGGGGVLVEAILSGRDCAGGDVNPLAVILSQAKTKFVPRSSILDLGEKVKNLSRKRINTVETSVVNPHISFWFHDHNLEDILALSEATKEVAGEEHDLKPVFQTILSATIRDVMLTYRGEVRLRKLRGKDLEKFNPDTFKVYNQRLILTAERVGALPKMAKCDVSLTDAREMPYESEQFYGIICSPPYADDKNGVGYFQFSKNMLAFLGFGDEELKEYRNLFHGMDKNEKNPPKSRALSLSLENVLKQDKSKYQEAVAFYADYAKTLEEMRRVVKKWVIIVIGNRVLARTAFDNAAITVDIFRNLGVELHDHYTREIRKKRIPNLGGDGGGITLEHVLVFKK
jgi:DNA modification methylase